MATNINTGIWYSVVASGTVDYVLKGLPVGSYHVVSYVIPGNGTNLKLVGGYTQAVLCGLKYGCDDHALLPVEVRAAQITSNIDPGDWYAPENFFPPDPANP